MRILLAIACLGVAATSARAQTLQISASPQNAAIFRLKPQDNSLIPIGVGTAQLKLDDKDPNTVIVRLEGYRDVTRSFPKSAKYDDKKFTLFLTRRIVKITALPYDANIMVNGENKGQRNLELDVEEGQTVTVEVRKPGFAPIKHTYRHERGAELPPPTDRFELVDRQVSVSTTPSGGQIMREGTKIGDNIADVVIPQGACVTVTAQKIGWLPAEQNYCNKDGVAAPPIEDRLVMAGRVVFVNGPPGAKILVNQREAGIGSFPVRINDGTCATVRVDQAGYVPFTHEYCAQLNAPPPPLEEPVTLKLDESYAASAQSDQANVNISLEVGKTRTEDQAWKLIASIVLSHFDILENSDSQTGYLRTAWQPKVFNNGEVIVRTRVIVKRAGTAPLRYTIQIASERNRRAGISVKDDENFMPWDRILSMYKDVISEMQARIQ